MVPHLWYAYRQWYMIKVLIMYHCPLCRKVEIWTTLLEASKCSNSLTPIKAENDCQQASFYYNQLGIKYVLSMVELAQSSYNLTVLHHLQGNLCVFHRFSRFFPQIFKLKPIFFARYWGSSTCFDWASGTNKKGYLGKLLTLYLLAGPQSLCFCLV